MISFFIIFFQKYILLLRNKDEKDSTAVELCEYNLVIFPPTKLGEKVSLFYV